VAFGDRHERLHLGRKAIEVNHDDAFGAGRYRGFDEVGVEPERGAFRVHKHRRRAAVRDDVSGCDKGKCRNDDFIAGTDSERDERNVKSAGSVIRSDRIGRVRSFTNGLLEAIDKWTAGTHPGARETIVDVGVLVAEKRWLRNGNGALAALLRGLDDGVDIRT
jgi:hypothetical protein